LKVSQIEQAQSQIVLSIEVEPPELEEHLNRAYRKTVQRVNIRGFRKGKAPRSVVERELGRDALLEEALEALLPQMTSRAIEEQKLDVVATPRVKVTQNEPLIIEATIAVRPPVDLGDYHQLRLEKPEKVEVSPETVEEVVNSLRQENGAWEPVERPVELEDMVTMAVHGEVDEAVVIDDKGVEYVLTAASTSPLPGFAGQLVGIERGELREFTLPFPEEYPQTDLAGKECQFIVTVEEVKKRRLPDLDDEFVRSLNMKVETLAELRDKLREDVRQRLQQIADQHYQELAVQALVEKALVELPPLLVDEEVQHILSDQAEAMQRQQVKMEDYLSTVGKSVEQLQEEIRPSAVERITRSLILRALREKEGIEVNPEEIEEEMSSMLGESNTDTESLRQLLNTENGRASISNVLLNRKTLERLTSIARGEVMIVASSTGGAPAGEGQTEIERGA
jgi:trigger factor